jgi:hypothetical protein
MADRSRAFLKQEFSDGERPTGADFGDLIDSFINKEDDNVRLVSGNLNLPGGLNLANAATGQEGTLRFNGTQVEVFQGGVWNPIGGGGAFSPVGGGPHVAFDGGNVGIGNFAAAPEHRLEVPLGANTGPAEQIRLGSLAIHNGQTNDAAYVSHRSVTGDQTFALRQDSQGNTDVNAGPGAELILMQGTAARLRFNTGGNVTITPQLSATIAGNLQIGAQTPGQERNLLVTGQASKPGGGPFANSSSDARVKRDVKPLDVGLRELCELKPVYYKFNGEAGTPNDDKEYVGLIAQEVAEVVPFMVQTSDPIGEGGETRDLLTYDSGPLTYMLVNAVRELAARVAELESRLPSPEDGE